MNEKRFTIHKESKYKEEWYAYPFCIKEDGEVVLETIPLFIAKKVRDKLNEQQATIEEYEDFCLNLCKFLIGKGLVDEYREEYGKEYKIITKWKGCGSDE